MKYGEVLKKIKDGYHFVLDSLPKDFEDRQKYLRLNGANDGLCFYAISVGFPLSEEFIEDYTSGCLYLCQTPGNEEYHSAINLITRRIDRINEVYEKWKDVDYGTAS